jgi:acyl-CoA reductase-like NAD-dependent aldehyde dehydrogenase
VFGDTTTTAVWRNDPRVELHGPGYSKIVIGRDEIDNWERHLEVLVTSIVENGGRSCVNASGVWVTAGGQAIAEALAVRLAAIAPRPAEDDQAQLAPFADPAVARRISAMIDADLQQGGAHDVTADYRPGGRLATLDGCTYVLPTVIRCGPDHPLAHREFLFPFAAVVEVDDAVLPEGLGPTLVVSAITADTSLIRRLLASPLVDRLNIGSIPTNHLSWNQPHEGNLFEHLYGRRAFQRSA